MGEIGRLWELEKDSHGVDEDVMGRARHSQQSINSAMGDVRGVTRVQNSEREQSLSGRESC